MKKMILSLLTISASVLMSDSSIAATKDIEGFYCVFQVDDRPNSFNLPYEAQGHILTSVNGVPQDTMLGLPFGVSSSNFPSARIYTYRLTSGEQRLLMQVQSPTGEVLATRINNANIESDGVSGETTKTINGATIVDTFYDLSCSRMH